MKITASAPCRVDVVGGAIDMTRARSVRRRAAKKCKLPLVASRLRYFTPETGLDHPAMYGGVGAIEPTPTGIARPRGSGINNREAMKAHLDGDRAVHRNFDRIAAIASAMRQALGKADWTEAARLLREEWGRRRKNAPGITTPLVDRLVEVGRRNGATGAKVCGAGGGGCVFLVERGAKERVARAIEAESAAVLDVKAARRGVQLRVGA